MRTLILATICFVGATASAAESQDLTLDKVLRAASCTAAPTAATGDASTVVRANTCKQLAYTFCYENQDSKCSTYFKDGGGPRPQNPPIKAAIQGTDFESVKTSAETSEANAISPKAKNAQNCCGGDVSACKGAFIAGGEPQTASSEIDQAVNAVPGDGGLKNKCAVYQKQTDNAGKVSSGVAGMCKAYKAMCVDQYQRLAKLIKEKASGADAEKFTSLASEYERKGQACESLTSVGAEQNAQTMVNDSNMGEECKNQTADDPTGTNKDKGGGDKKGGATKEAGDKKGGGDGMKDMMQMLPQALQALTKKDDDKKDDSASTTAPDCSNPFTAGCTQAAATAWNAPTGAAAATAGSSGSTAGKFDVGDTSGAQAGTMAAGGGSPGSPISVQSVPGGGGGGMGMGGGGGANMGGGAGGGGAGGGPKSNTDILHGEGGGGGGLSAMNAGMSTAAGAGSGGYNYGKGGGAGAGADAAVDWRQFLPGGAKDPTRKLAGATPARVEIQSVGTNIFNRVSERIRARCAQGLLRDCN